MNKIVFAQMAARLEGGAGEQKKTGMLAFSRIMEAEEKVGVATISGYIGYGNATVDEFTKHLEELKAEGCTKFEVILNSMGGNLFEASGIYDIIKGCGMEVTAKIYGVAASAATLIACAAGRVLISENSRYMVHRARGCAVGTVEEIEAYAADLKDAEGQVTGIYAERTGKSPEDVLAVLNAETWMNAETAVKEGWCDEVISPSAADSGQKETAAPGKEEDGGGEGEDPDEEEKGGPPQNYTVLRRMMAAVGLAGKNSVEELEREVARLVAENERLAAENDGFRGMQGHEREFEQRVKEAVVREMAAIGVAPVGLPPAEGATEEPGKKEPAMTNEKLREMAAQDALEWIMGHPQEAARLAEQPGK